MFFLFLVAELEDELKELKNKTISAPPAPPLPPPPPPPPPLPSSTQSSLYSTMTLKIKKSAAKAESSEGSAADQMADLLGIQNKTPSLKVPGGRSELSFRYHITSNKLLCLNCFILKMLLVVFINN